MRAGEIYIQIMLRFGRLTEEPPSAVGMVSPGFERFWELWNPIWSAAAGAPVYDPLAERGVLSLAWGRFLEETPLLLAPVATVPAFAVEREHDGAWLRGWPAAMRMIVAINLLGLPSVALPVGVADGLPQGVQIVGPRFREDLCLQAAAAVEQRLGVLTPIAPR